MTSAPTNPLSRREEQVAVLAARGATNAEIASAFGIGERTVEWNLTRVYRKLGLRSKVELAAHVAEYPWAERPIAEDDNRGNTAPAFFRGDAPHDERERGR